MGAWAREPWRDAAAFVVAAHYPPSIIMSGMSAEVVAQRIYTPNAVSNEASLTSVKFLSACFAGAVAGILGLTNWLGFALFFASTLFTSACLYAVNCQWRPSKYVLEGWTLLNPGQDNVFSFVEFQLNVPGPSKLNNLFRSFCGPYFMVRHPHGMCIPKRSDGVKLLHQGVVHGKRGFTIEDPSRTY